MNNSGDICYERVKLIESDKAFDKLYRITKILRVNTMKIKDLSDDYILLADSQEIKELLENIGLSYRFFQQEHFDGLFVLTIDGHILEVYAFEGTVPELEKNLHYLYNNA